MAAFASMSLNDGQTTPVAHSFTAGKSGTTPDGRLYFQWLDFSVNGGVPIGANRIDLYVRMPSFSMGKSTRKGAGDRSQLLAAEFVITLPTLESLSNNTASGINPQPTHAFDTTLWVKLVRNGRAGQQPVKDALAFMRNFSQNSQLVDTVLTYGPPTT